jgi:hypothetical protein
VPGQPQLELATTGNNLDLMTSNVVPQIALALLPWQARQLGLDAQRFYFQGFAWWDVAPIIDSYLNRVNQSAPALNRYAGDAHELLAELRDAYLDVRREFNAMKTPASAPAQSVADCPGLTKRHRAMLSQQNVQHPHPYPLREQSGPGIERCSSRLTLTLSHDLGQEPGTALSFVDPVLDQTSCGNVVVLFAQFVRRAQVSRQLQVVLTKFPQHLLRRD